MFFSAGFLLLLLLLLALASEATARFLPFVVATFFVGGFLLLPLLLLLLLLMLLPLLTRSPCHPRTSSGLSHIHGITGYLPRKAWALGIPKGTAPMQLSLLARGGAVPCVSGSFAATSSSPSLSIGGGTSSATRGGAAEKNYVTANWCLGFSGGAVPARCFRP